MKYLHVNGLVGGGARGLALGLTSLDVPQYTYLVTLWNLARLLPGEIFFATPCVFSRFPHIHVDGGESLLADHVAVNFGEHVHRGRCFKARTTHGLTRRRAASRPWVGVPNSRENTRLTSNVQHSWTVQHLEYKKTVPLRGLMNFVTEPWTTVRRRQGRLQRIRVARDTKENKYAAAREEDRGRVFTRGIEMGARMDDEFHEVLYRIACQICEELACAPDEADPGAETVQNKFWRDRDGA